MPEDFSNLLVQIHYTPSCMNPPQIGQNPRDESVQWIPRLPWIYRFGSLFCATAAACVAYYGVFVLRFTVRGFATLLAATIFGNVPRAIRRIGFDRLHKRRREYANWIVSSPSAERRTVIYPAVGIPPTVER